MTSGGGFDERQRQEPCVEWTRDDGATRGEGSAPRGDATTSWQGEQETIERQTRGKGTGKHEAAVWRESQRGQREASQRRTTTTRVDKYSTLGKRAAQQKSLQGECGGGLREVAHEFGGRIPHGGGNRDSGSVGMG